MSSWEPRTVDFSNKSAFLILEADHSLEGNSPCCMTKSVASYGRDTFRISTSFLVTCLCSFKCLVLFCVIYQGALPALFPTCLRENQKAQMMSFLIKTVFPPMTITLFNVICQPFYPHICRTKLLKSKHPHRAEALYQYFHEYLKSQMHFCQSVGF